MPREDIDKNAKRIDLKSQKANDDKAKWVAVKQWVKTMNANESIWLWRISGYATRDGLSQLLNNSSGSDIKVHA